MKLRIKGGPLKGGQIDTEVPDGITMSIGANDYAGQIHHNLVGHEEGYDIFQYIGFDSPDIMELDQLPRKQI